MASKNTLTIIGRVGQDPKTRKTENSTVTNLTVATHEKWKDKSGEWQEDTEWHNVVVWGKSAEWVGEKVGKGDLVYCEGPVKSRKWTDENGVEKPVTEMKARSVQMLSKKQTELFTTDEVPF